jgi:hypothetical protein
MAKDSSSSRTSDATKSSVKAPQIVEVGRSILKDGKEGKIIWIGDESHEKNVKILWAEGSVGFFSTKELQ